ncbi:hypothetical protein ILUMI_27175 [Ignelater luminosus]|uniref:Cytochrome P450 n=1 Tax=Ignelater luminosus TaxID=2038154 RepID=A0A8K0C3P2_IGNLU|nr:hypothetical protein ILUMI_27175 [Ignelater luminosus]
MIHVWLKIDLLFKLTPYAKREREVIIKKKKEEYYRKCGNSNGDIAQRMQEDPRRYSILDLMIELSSNGSGFTDEELRDEVTTIISAGSDTTAMAIGYVLIMLALHPQYQEKVYQEVMDVLGPDRTLEHTDLKHLAYTEMVLKETLRIYPASPVIGRIAEEDIHLENCTIPANSSFLIHILEIHRNSEIFPDPLKFDPDRFLPEEIAKRHPCSWIPFVAGPRNCIGLNYAMMQMKSIMAYLIRRYKFKTPYKSIEDVEIRIDLLIKPVHGHLVSIEPRQ